MVSKKFRLNINILLYIVMEEVVMEVAKNFDFIMYNYVGMFSF